MAHMMVSCYFCLYQLHYLSDRPPIDQGRNLLALHCVVAFATIIVTTVRFTKNIIHCRCLDKITLIHLLGLSFQCRTIDSRLYICETLVETFTKNNDALLFV